MSFSEKSFFFGRKCTCTRLHSQFSLVSLKKARSCAHRSENFPYRRRRKRSWIRHTGRSFSSLFSLLLIGHEKNRSQEPYSRYKFAWIFNNFLHLKVDYKGDKLQSKTSKSVKKIIKEMHNVFLIRKFRRK